MPKKESIKAVVPSNKVSRNGKNYDRTYFPQMEPFVKAPCKGEGCGKQVTDDSSKLLGYYDDSSSFDKKIFGTSNTKAYGQWNIPTTYANKKDSDGKLRTRKIQLSEQQLMDPKFQRDSLTQGDKIYFRNPSVKNTAALNSNKVYGKDKTDQDIRHVAMAMGKNDKGEVLFQHSMAGSSGPSNQLYRETLPEVMNRATIGNYIPKVAYRTIATQKKLQGHPELGYDKKTTIKTDSNSDYVNGTKEAIYRTKEEIGVRNGLNRSLMDKLSANVIPIGVQESGAGFKKLGTTGKVEKASGLSNWIDEAYDSKFANNAVKPLAKMAKNIASNAGSFINRISDGEYKEAFSASGGKRSPWQLELEANKLAKKNPKQYKAIYENLKYENDKNYVSVMPDESSKGFGKIKQIPAVAKELGVTKESLMGSRSDERALKIKNNAIASTAVLAENAKRIKAKYPKLTEDQVADMATTAYNSGLDSILNNEYVNNYVINKRKGVDGKVLTSNYLEKIKKLRGPVNNSRL